MNSLQSLKQRKQLFLYLNSLSDGIHLLLISVTREILDAAHVKSCRGGIIPINSRPIRPCILNADEAVMIPPLPERQPGSHRSALNRTGFMTQADSIESWSQRKTSEEWR